MNSLPEFDGRSYLANRLRYTLAERIINLVAMNVMPLLTRLLCSHRLNTAVWRALGCRVGAGSVIRMGTQINAPARVRIGRHCQIHGILKSRGGIDIGDGVEFVEEVLVSTQSHDMDSELFESIYAPVRIGDHAWLGPRAIVLPGVTLAPGSVAAAASVLTKDTEPWGVYAGIPAQRIKWRKPLRGHA